MQLAGSATKWHDRADAFPHELPGTYRVADGAKVEFSDALATWIPLAYDELVATAHTYHAVITYMELSQRVQDVSGMKTRMLLANWIGKLLEEVARRSVANDEPPLTSLCGHQDGTIGSGYARAPKTTQDAPGEDIELYAAAHRLMCYQKYATDLPSDGGMPALTRAERERRAREISQKPEDAARLDRLHPAM
ncbi:hypothetical protein [Pseudonocardia sp. GCM10023141]|uniref:hypothetical protein n=1 Tax=Pseudonocardia sp. GCM10023141 TaxID=3252653 RepID=UPI00362038D6